MIESLTSDGCVYYNENDPKSAAWLRELIKAGAIAPGEVDDRSILDVAPSDLSDFTQCHFFAGIGVWSYALRLAGWSDNRSVWTGSCPCQPFSAAGKGGGFDDERHLWPAWFHLIAECRPRVVFGEQVASKDAGPWLDLVQTDVEAVGYAFGAIAIPAAGVGAPHIRDRAYFVADADYARSQRRSERRDSAAEWLARTRGVAGGLAVASSERLEGERLQLRERGSLEAVPEAGWDGEADELADAAAERRREGGSHATWDAEGNRPERLAAGSVSGSHARGFWRTAEWVYCRDDKYRPVEPGSFPLAHGPAARVGRLRGYGNAIVAPLAAEVIAAYMEDAA